MRGLPVPNIRTTLFSDEKLNIWSYSLETMLAEKLETTVSILKNEIGDLSVLV